MPTTSLPRRDRALDPPRDRRRPSRRRLYAALTLRAAVFVVEQDCPYLDPDGRDLEPTTQHLWIADDDGAMAAYLRVLARARRHAAGSDASSPIRASTRRALAGRAARGRPRRA